MIKRNVDAVVGGLLVALVLLVSGPMVAQADAHPAQTVQIKKLKKQIVQKNKAIRAKNQQIRALRVQVVNPPLACEIGSANRDQLWSVIRQIAGRFQALDQEGDDYDVSTSSSEYDTFRSESYWFYGNWDK